MRSALSSPAIEGFWLKPSVGVKQLRFCVHEFRMMLITMESVEVLYKYILIHGIVAFLQSISQNCTEIKVSARKARHLVISTNNKYCFAQYLLYLMSPIHKNSSCYAFQKYLQSHKHWSRDDSSALAVPSFVVMLFWTPLYPDVLFQFSYMIQDITTSLNSVPNICPELDQTQVHKLINESYRSDHLFNGKTMAKKNPVLMEGNRKLVHAPLIQWKGKLAAFKIYWHVSLLFGCMNIRFLSDVLELRWY